MGLVGNGKGGGDEASDAERKPHRCRPIIEALFWASPPRHPSIDNEDDEDSELPLEDFKIEGVPSRAAI